MPPRGEAAIRVLLSVPPGMAAHALAAHRLPAWFHRLRAAGGPRAFVAADPEGRRLGSGGGTVGLLHAAWRADRRAGRGGRALEAWLEADQKLVLHAGGESRRLPAYAAVGKAFLPLPAVEGLRPRLADQVLADFQLPSYAQALLEAGPGAAALVTSGDVWLDFDPTELPPMRADLVGIGMRVSPEVAQHFGVFFVDRHGPEEGPARPIAFFLQKPRPAEIAAHLDRHDFFVDTGMWLLGPAALRLLFRRCGWDPARGRFATPDGHPRFLDLYGEVGCALGARGRPPRALAALGFSRLATAVVPLHEARFHHLGSSRQLLESMEQIQRTPRPRRALEVAAAGSFRTEGRATTWVEGSAAVAPLRLEGENLVTGLPPGARVERLGPGACLDVAPVGPGAFVVRPYHLDDAGRGPPASATLCGRLAAAWLERRGLAAAVRDVHELPLYPVLPAAEIDQALVDGFFEESPARGWGERYARARRLSGAEIPGAIDLGRWFDQRRRLRAQGLRRAFEASARDPDGALFDQDFASVADFCRRDAPALGRWLLAEGERLLAALGRSEHEWRLAMLLSRLAGGDARERLRSLGFGRLRSALLSARRLPKASPRLTLKEDQIVWGRSPVRLDLAGGWTDTPPFCLEAGGTVLNLAVLLNGQPPIQVFVRPVPEPVLRLRSIDLGASETVTTRAQLARVQDPRGTFSVPKAALALAGFLPEFHAGRATRTLRAQLLAAGGGLELSLLAAVPKGSGLGTSSILAATVLGALSRALGLGWTDLDLYDRVLGVEQLLTTGGGWQDQAGALFPSLKLVETPPGARQRPTVRYLPEWTLDGVVNAELLLYYTGATRVAKGILQEIVHDMFLGRAETVRTLEGIRANAWRLFHALQLGDREGVHRCVARSWRLNKALDAGTTTPEIERILARCGDDLAAAKLLGAGGGGYVLLCARDAEAGRRIRGRLEASPPNPRARFIDFALARHGLQVSVS